MAAAAKTTAMAWSSLLLLSLAVVVHDVDGATSGGGSVGAPAPSMDCTDALLSLADCLSYVQEGSTVKKPEESCCSGLKDVVKKEVACLCQAFQGSQDYGVTLNMTKALQLPDACKVKTPPFSKCHLSIPGAPDGSPAAAPAPLSGAPFFGGSPSPSAGSLSPSMPSAGSPLPFTPSAESPAGTESGSPALAPSPSKSAAAAFPASTDIFLATITASLTLLTYIAV